MSQSKLIRLSAKYAREVGPGVYESDFDTSLMTNIKAISLKTLIFRNNKYNVLTSDLFWYTVVGVGSYNASVPVDGFYNLQQLIDIIKPQIQSNLTSIISMDINQFNGKIVVSHTGFPDEIILNGSFGLLNKKMGNTVDSGQIIENVPYTFNGFAALGGLESVTISIASKSPKTILNVSSTKIRHTNSLGVVPVTVPFLGLQTYEQPDLDSAAASFSFPESFSKIRFTLRDVDGSVILNQTEHLVVECMLWLDV